MEWQQLMGFFQVAKLGSFTRAARATFRTQSALSQQVKALEQESQCRLIERLGPGRLRLTPAGERLLKFAELVFREFDHLSDDLTRLRGQTGGRLRIAAPFTTLYHLFPPVLEAYRRRRPEVEWTILDRPQRRVFELVREGEVDCGLGLESQVPRDLEARPWKRVATMLMTPRDHPLSRIRPVHFEHLAAYSLILPPREVHHPCRLRLEEEFLRLGLTPRVVMESSNVELSALYVELGLGISLATVVADLPTPAARAVAFQGLGGLFPDDRLALVTRRNQPLAEHQRAFLELLFGEL